MADYSQYIKDSSKKYGVSEDLLNSMVARESAGQAMAKSSAGAQGLMQLMPDTAKQYGVNPWDPQQNIDGGAHYISDLQKKYGGDNAKALMAYNWGPGNMDSFLSTGKGITSTNIPAETLNYAHNILTDIDDQVGLMTYRGLAAQTPGYKASTVGKGTGQPKAAIQNPRKNDVEVQDQSKIVRDKDFGARPSIEGVQADIHESYFASAEISIGDVVICPLAPLRPVEDENGDVDLETAGSDIRLEEFQYRSVTQTGNMAVFRLFLKSWSDVVETMALIASQEDADVRFGYLNLPDMIVGPFKVRVISVTPEFRENGYTLVVEAIDADTAKNLKSGNKTVTWRARSGRISDIAYYIATQNGWDTCIEQSEALDPNTAWTQSQQTDLNFLQNTLGPNAKSEVQREEVKGGKVGPYVAYLQPRPRPDGKPVLHFHPLKPTSKSPVATPQRSYVWGGVQESESRTYGTVVSFNPHFDSQVFSMIGGSRLASQSVDIDRKILNIIEVAGSDVKDRGLQGNEGQQTLINLSSKEPARGMTVADHDLDIAASRAVSRYFRLRDCTFTASMTILGDPYLRAGITINVLAMRPDAGSIMFYDWFIVEAIHTITGGEYVVNLQLTRTTTGPKMTDASLPGLGAGAGPFYSQTTDIIKRFKGMAVGKSE